MSRQELLQAARSSTTCSCIAHGGRSWGAHSTTILLSTEHASGIRAASSATTACGSSAPGRGRATYARSTSATRATGARRTSCRQQRGRRRPMALAAAPSLLATSDTCARRLLVRLSHSRLERAGARARPVLARQTNKLVWKGMGGRQVSHAVIQPRRSSLACTPCVELGRLRQHDSEYRAQWARVSRCVDEPTAHRGHTQWEEQPCRAPALYEHAFTSIQHRQLESSQI
jgi:hypothetical protein